MSTYDVTDNFVYNAACYVVRGHTYGLLKVGLRYSIAYGKEYLIYGFIY